MKKFMSRAICVLLLLAVSLTAFACATAGEVEAGKNLVVNGSFEDDLNGWTTGGSVSEFDILNHSTGSDNNVKYGDKYLSVFNRSESVATIKQTIRLQPGATYKLTAVVRVDNALTNGNLTGKDKEKMVGAHIGFAENVHFIKDSKISATTGFVTYNYFFTTEFRDVTLQAVIGATGGEVKGTAYFDDIKLVKLTDTEANALPDSIIEKLASYVPNNGGVHSALYIFIGLIALVAVIYGVWVAIRRSGWVQKAKDSYGIVRFMTGKGALWTLLGVAFVIRFVLGFLYTGYGSALSDMTGISDKIASVGLGQYYAQSGYSMLPFGVYLTAIFGGLANLLGATGGWAYLIFKLPAIICDLVTIYFIYKLGKKFIGQVGGILAGLLWAICPTVLTVNSMWGTLDSVIAMLAVMLFYFILDPNGIKSWKRFTGIFVTLTVGVLTKIEMLWFVPLVAGFLIYNFITKKELRTTLIIGTVASVVGFWLMSLPLTIGYVGEGRVFYIWELFFEYMVTGVHYFARDNFGLYALVGLSWSTGVKTLSLVMNLVFAMLIFAFTIIIYLKQRSRVELLLLGALTIIAGYTFGIDMSPTVLLVGLVLLFAYAIVSNEKRVFLAFAIFAGIAFLNTTFTLAVSGALVPFALGGVEYLAVGGAMSIIMSIVQILAFFYLVYVVYDITINEKMKQIDFIDGYDTATIWGRFVSRFKK